MDHFRPHTHRTFEGYYSKFTLPSGASLVVIICSVPNAAHHPHMVSLTHVPKDFPRTPHFQHELWVDTIHMVNLPPNTSPSSPKPTTAFELRIPSVGQMTVLADSTTTYSLTAPDGSFTFTATIPGSTQVPYHRSHPLSTPESLLIHLPLPLHWHVHTLASQAQYTLTLPSSYPHLSPLDSSPSTPALVHQEKNWAHSFPSSHVWISAYNARTRSGLSLAGGSILGVQAYLLSYHARDPQHDLSFTPPWALAPSVCAWLSPTMRAEVDWDRRRVRVVVSGWTRRIEVEARAEPGSFVGLSAPFHDGHRENALGESFGAVVQVKVFGGRGWGRGWRLLCEERFEGAALEFGGEVYGAGGSGERVN